MKAGVHYVHVHVKRRRGASTRGDDDVCRALKEALDELEATPGRARCIAERGQRLARSLTMERVTDYTAAVLRRAAAAQKPDVARKIESTNVVTKRNLLRHVSASTKPWIERIFLPWHVGANVSRAAGGRAAGALAVAQHTKPASRTFTFS